MRHCLTDPNIEQCGFGLILWTKLVLDLNNVVRAGHILALSGRQPILFERRQMLKQDCLDRRVVEFPRQQVGQHRITVPNEAESDPVYFWPTESIAIESHTLD